MIEHFSKWLELGPLPDCSSEGVAYAFLDKVLSTSSALTDVFTDQDIKF